MVEKYDFYYYSDVPWFFQKLDLIGLVLDQSTEENKKFST